mmetsp:Transcript_20007/g.14719  ORF Transcript_20007/g.14719 Transcript_20007/m.14719 type:complete len:168 (+) Transcript_20007:607-1110(+)|eukprot:CAMPEP_0202957902 /NCGR_PEP_ID=MMETSP1396-20130829/2276_1 /ASSEMBLY_ACC=CAM_ASM_000872 /TAXON_ID= /ORGANISM="Pseudokeronopsis sp., Strain Brazil" /LENGTH=167 /DNA_ID=CAMNT_0049675641 /DNA_START=1347 /DNA_END=1850 /DNA_ORIENTATION=-
MLMQKLQDFMNSINDKLDELMKLKARVAKLEKQMKKLKKMIAMLGHFSDHSPARDEDDAMFTKKPLLGNSCASCDKDIINLIGRGADFYAWQKFPSRDITDKISKGRDGKFVRIKTTRPNSAVKATRKNYNQQLYIDEIPEEGGYVVSDQQPDHIRIRRNLQGRNPY